MKIRTEHELNILYRHLRVLQFRLCIRKSIVTSEAVPNENKMIPTLSYSELMKEIPELVESIRELRKFFSDRNPTVHSFQCYADEFMNNRNHVYSEDQFHSLYMALLEKRFELETEINKLDARQPVHHIGNIALLGLETYPSICENILRDIRRLRDILKTLRGDTRSDVARMDAIAQEVFPEGTEKWHVTH